MKNSFQEKLQSLKHSQNEKQSKPIISDKIQKRREEERNTREEIALNWYESLLAFYQENVSIKQISELFIQHYSNDNDEDSLSEKLSSKPKLVIVEFLKHYVSNGIVPEELKISYVLLLHSYICTQDERNQELLLQKELSNLQKKYRANEKRIHDLNEDITKERPRIERAKQQLEDNLKEVTTRTSFIDKLGLEYKKTVQVLQDQIRHLASSDEALLIERELEKELKISDGYQILSQIERISKQLNDHLVSYQECKRFWTDAFHISFPNGITGYVIESGSYWRGSLDGKHDEKPLRTIQIDFSLWISTIPITQGIFVAVMGFNPSSQVDLQRPVEMINWYEAIMFCNRLSMNEKLDCAYIISDNNQVKCNWDANGYRLPTEAEWEIAARANENFRYSGSDVSKNVAWTKENSKHKTQRVRQRRPNGWGLYDMSGNVWEWCWDGYQEDYYAQSPKLNPTGPDIYTKRVLRGGSIETTEDKCRVSARYSLPPEVRDTTIGFRIVRRES